MKRLLLLVFLLAALAGCSVGTDPAPLATVIPTTAPTATTASLPPTASIPSPTPIDATGIETPGVSPVTGSLVIEDGRCCAGGLVFEEITVEAEFAAQSTAGEVTEMRTEVWYASCAEDDLISSDTWEPFVTGKGFPATPSSGFTTWALKVQYRDSIGNESPVYCGDIALEGLPPTPAP